MSLRDVRIENDHGHGKNTKVFVDDVEQVGISRIEIAFDAMDIVRMKSFSFMKGVVDTKALVDHTFVAQIGIDMGASYEVVGKGEGKTAKEAMQAAVDAMEDPE